MKLIVGLGNPGNEYENTRHNVGFMVLDKYAQMNNFKFNMSKFNGIYFETYINNEKIIFLKPQSYMNLSGEVIIKFINYYKIDIKDILVICDDLDLDIGKYKLRYKGSSTHNGIRNIILNTNTNEFKRIRVGISKNKNIPTDKYVLGKFTNEEKIILTNVINKLIEIISEFPNFSFENLMNKYN